MDSRLKGYYNSELQHLRGMTGEFAREFPKIAGRLAIEDFACADPYVERLLEGFAFLAARVQLKLDAEFPRFTQAILETVFPHYLAPTPSMMVAQFVPEMAEGSLMDGYTIKRGESVRSLLGKGDRTTCEYRTALPVTLWPLDVAEGAYCTRELAALGLPAGLTPARAGVRLRLQAPPGVNIANLKMDSLTFFLRGADELPMHVYEQIFAHTTNVVVRPAARPTPWQKALPADCLKPVGFVDDEALLPTGPHSFQGYRLLREYFSFPQRFLFFRLDGLRECVRRCDGSALELILLFDKEDLALEGRLDASNFALFCAPAINLFPKRTDRIHLSDKTHESHVVPDRTRPLDFEIFQIREVTGHGVRTDEDQPFSPFYAARDFGVAGGSGAYFTVHRVPRQLTTVEKERGRRSGYGGSDVYLSLVDSKSAPYRSDLQQLSVEALCTNRDLPLQIPIGRSASDFTMDVSAPLVAIRCVASPTAPRPSNAEGETAWRVISHLSLNYLSLVDGQNGGGVTALRDLLKLYGNAADPQIAKQIEGLLSVESRPVTRRVMTSGPIAFARGLEITLVFDEVAFEGTGVFLLGAVMAHFFARYVSLNSFAETVIRTKERGEIMRWPARVGSHQVL